MIAMMAPPRVLTLFLVLAAAATAPSPARCKDAGGSSGKQDYALAKTHFDKGVEFFKAEDYGAALAEFLESYRIVPAWEFKFNIATCYLKMKKYVKSLALFRQYIDEGGGGVPKDRKKKVLEDIEKLEGMVGRVVFCCGLEGGRLVVDETETYDKLPDEPVLLDPGEHRIEIVKEGFKPFETMMKVVTGENRLEVTLEPLDEGAPPAGGGGKPATKKLSGPQVWLISGLAGGAALAIAASVTGGLVLYHRDEMNKAAGPCDVVSRDTCPDVYSHLDTARSLKIATNVLVGAAAAAGVVGLAVFLAKRRKAPLKEKISAGLGLAPGGMMAAELQVRF
jgi:hypothetical protein